MRSTIILAGTAALLLASGASASVINASDVIAADLGTVRRANADADRYVSTNALGAADGAFYALGLGGEITLGFGKTFSGTTDIRVTEVTYGSLGHIGNYGEAVDVFAVSGGVSSLIGRLTNLEAYNGRALSYTGMFDSLRFVDTTREAFGRTPSYDGFDIDSVELTSTIAPIPLPASGGLLLAGFAALGLRKRRKA